MVECDVVLTEPDLVHGIYEIDHEDRKMPMEE